MYNIEKLNKLSIDELLSIAQKLAISQPETLEQQTLIYKILDKQAATIAQETPPPTTASKETTKAPNPKSTYKKKAFPSNRKNTSQKNGAQPSATKESKPAKAPANHRSSHYKNANVDILANIVSGEGVLDIMQEGYGFLRSADYNYLSSIDDIYISHNLIKTWGLTKGDTVRGKIRPPKEKEKYFGLLEIESVNGLPLTELRKRKEFQNLVPIFPNKKFNLSYLPNQFANRFIDLFAPIGFGQRAILLAPPKAGKTTLLKNIARGISKNHPDVYLLILMIDERPEEVTDMRRSVEAEIIASTFDEQGANHIKVVSMAIEKAKRMLECEYDVVIILDSLTRLARAYNQNMPSSGKILSGGVDPNALHMLKRIFGIARNIDGGGSLTVIASALIDTGSRMDEVVVEEIRGRANTDLVLNASLANKGYYPAMDIQRSGTRRGEDMQSPEELKYINILKRVMADMNSPEERLKFLLDNIKGTKTNEEFLARIHY